MPLDSWRWAEGGYAVDGHCRLGSNLETKGLEIYMVRDDSTHDIDVVSCVGDGEVFAVVREAEPGNGVAVEVLLTFCVMQGSNIDYVLASRDGSCAYPFFQVEHVDDGIVPARGKVSSRTAVILWQGLDVKKKLTCREGPMQPRCILQHEPRWYGRALGSEIP